MLKSKVVPHFPDGLAREYERITNTYMSLLNKTLAEHLPVIRKAIDAEREGLRRDDAQDILALIESEFLRINEDYMSRTEKFSLASKLLGISVLARNHKIREWKRVVSKTLGISIFDDYFKGEFFREMLKVWVAQNIDLIKTIPKNTLLKMRYAIEEGYTNGMVNTAIGKRIQEIYGIDRRRARFIARDQIAKLNADITQAQHRDAG
ncbi:MAG: hypothetical protein LBS19_15965 [Clostridiales bacterium]|nr:hypothetical protein [Clostridiales bacterium]